MSWSPWPALPSLQTGRLSSLLKPGYLTRCQFVVYHINHERDMCRLSGISFQERAAVFSFPQSTTNRTHLCRMSVALVLMRR